MNTGVGARTLRIFVLLVAASALGASTAGAAPPLTLAEALRRAEERSPALAVRALDGEVAEAEWQEDPDVSSPSIRFGVDKLVPGALTGPDAYARLRLPLPRPWEIVAARADARADAVRQGAQLEEARDALRGDVRSLFHLLPVLRQIQEVAVRFETARAARLEIVRRQRADGLATTLQWLDADNEALAASEAAAEARADQARVQSALGRLVGWPAGEPLELVAEPAEALVRQGLAEVEDRLARAASGSFDLRAADAAVQQTRARLQGLLSRGVPWLEWGQVGINADPQGLVELEIGLSVDLPVQFWSGTATRSARAALAVAEAERAAAQDEVRTRTQEQHARVEALTARWTLEQEHLTQLQAETAPMRHLADPGVLLELDARVARSELRVLRALAELLLALDALDPAAAPPAPAP